MTYLWAKWLHIIAVISWMAGLLYLFRLFVYHQKQAEEGPAGAGEMLTTMEGRLLKFITVPAAAIAWGAGLTMIMLNAQILTGKWLHHKITLVLLLTAVTWWGASLARTFASEGRCRHSVRRLKMINEVPTVLMMIIVWLVVFRPF